MNVHHGLWGLSAVVARWRLRRVAKRRVREMLQPEKRLQLAVLQDAMLTFHRLAGANAVRSRRLFSEVDDWFASEDRNGPFAFVTICDTLNLDPSYIRDGLRRSRARRNGAAKRKSEDRDVLLVVRLADRRGRLGATAGTGE